MNLPGHAIKRFQACRQVGKVRLQVVCLGFFWMIVSGPSMGHGGYDEEIRIADEQIATDPCNGGIWFHRAELHYLHGDWMRALLDLEKSNQLAPGKYPVALVRGKALMAGGKLRLAKTALDEFVKANPESPDGFATRARVELALGDHESAVADFHRALARTRSPEPDLFVETAEASVAAGHPEAALEDLEEGISRLGEIPSLVCKALEMEESLGRFNSALARVSGLEKSVQRPEPWMARRASILAKADRIPESVAAWTGLRDHLLKLPISQRNSHAMSLLLEQTGVALQSLGSGESSSTSNVLK